MSPQDSLAERYGAPAPWRRRVLIGGCVAAVLVFAGWLVWVVWDQSTPAAESELVSFEVVDEHLATAVVEVRLDGDVRADCRLRAMAEDKTVVGELSFTPDPDAGPRYEEAVRTERRATSVESLGCTAPGQTRPR